MNNPIGLEVADYAGDDLEALATMHRYREWIVKHFEPYLGGRAVEVGAGIGNMAGHLIPHVDSLLLVEPSAHLVAKMTDRFDGNASISIRHGDLDGFFADTPGDAYDCVILVNLLEHIDRDLEALREAQRVLRDDGCLLILVPALQFLFSKLDEIHGHVRRYSRSELMRKMLDADFRVEYVSYFDMLGIAPWFLLNTLCGATTFNGSMMAIYDRFFVPTTRWIEGRITPPIGKNLIVVGRKAA